MVGLAAREDREGGVLVVSAITVVVPTLSLEVIGDLDQEIRF